jgi:hypothetical protein
MDKNVMNAFDKLEKQIAALSNEFETLKNKIDVPEPNFDFAKYSRIQVENNPVLVNSMKATMEKLKNLNENGDDNIFNTLAVDEQTENTIEDLMPITINDTNGRPYVIKTKNLKEWKTFVEKIESGAEEFSEEELKEILSKFTPFQKNRKDPEVKKYPIDINQARIEKERAEISKWKETVSEDPEIVEVEKKNTELLRDKWNKTGLEKYQDLYKQINEYSIELFNRLVPRELYTQIPEDNMRSLEELTRLQELEDEKTRLWKRTTIEISEEISKILKEHILEWRKKDMSTSYPGISLL